jgi:ECF sigma factor
MSDPAEHSITLWLGRLQAGDPDALDRLVPLVYDELRRVARRQLRREAPANTLSATTLVHEVYLRLVKQRQIEAGDRAESCVPHLKDAGQMDAARKRDAERLLAKLRSNQQ